jgi:biofilm protein TabA
MFLSHIQHRIDHLPALVQLAIQHLREHDYSQEEAGKYPIDGDNMFALVQDPMTQSWETGSPEFHQRHIDVQFLLEGEEAMGYLPADPDLELITDKLLEKDIAFVAPQERETRIVLSPGMYAVFYPGELHRPCRAVKESMQIKKVVIKILQK